jgi:hypothetical protein
LARVGGGGGFHTLPWGIGLRTLIYLVVSYHGFGGALRQVRVRRI